MWTQIYVAILRHKAAMSLTIYTKTAPYITSFYSAILSFHFSIGLQRDSQNYKNYSVDTQRMTFFKVRPVPNL